MNRSFGKQNTLELSSAGEKSGVVFFFFCLWTVVCICRPQDIFTFLVPVRPALTTGVLTLIVFFLNYSRKNLVALKEKQVRYFLLLFLIMIVSIPTSLYSRLSFEFVFFKYMMIVAYFVMFVLVVDSIERFRRVLYLVCIGSGIYMAFWIMTWDSGSGRLQSGGRFDPNDLAFFALCFIPLTLIFISKDNKLLVRVLCLICFFMGIGLIFLTSSRGGMLGLVMASAAIFFRTTVSISKRFKVFALIAVTFILSMSAIDTERFKSLLSIEQDYNVTSEGGRLNLWGIGIRAMLKNPLTGVGVKCFGCAVGEDRRNDPNAGTRKWQTAHNSIVQIGTETGVFGLMLFVMLSWNAVKIFARISREATSIKLKKIGEMGLAGFVGMFTAAFFLSQAYSFYWAFYIVLSAVAFRLLSNELALEGNKAKP